MYNENKSVSILTHILGFTNDNSRKLCYGLGLSLTFYILFPSINDIFWKTIKNKGENKPNRRLDRTTSGLINNANDCYANSSIQALVSLDTLTEYLNSILKDVTDGSKDLELIRTKYPLHLTLAELISKLETPTLNTQSFSVQPIKQTLEYIFKTRISREQHDAQEFTQVILDCLKDEYNMSNVSNETIKFPLQGQTGTQLVCLRCHETSELKLQDFSLYEVVAPQKYSTTLNDLFSQDQTDVVSDYKCLCCMMKMIITNENHLELRRRDDQSIGYTYIKEHYGSLFINSDIPEEIWNYIKMYNKNGCVPYSSGSDIFKRSVIVESPDILAIHISRSMFNGVSTTRNACRVSFEEEFTIPEQYIKDNKCISIKDVKYKLKSMVKHTGTHYQGHYQCYRHKPTFKMDTELEKMVNLSPTVKLPIIGPKINELSDNGFTSIQEGTTTKKRYKKIKSVNTKSFWKISDASIQEVNLNSVLSETKYVYMLYYEKTK
ncbi:similar to Saccharomyces cerevisiae YPL072W UBP16 Deubiquitinating enzyme anchored to the outer mitochondrial membrane [Maudiozyma barnettii]|uniref:Ubiquitin carboxyl-terminal hydrolase n=1 Tax=Maudiozyma barnettii TaxID=61262 RepID=A0A8H2VID6_9SACH|nr:putative ubiquitin-specific protease UBP16 [Kazachstania barnettii]CAB4255809.1 similar to Saccharomyces cerevisiae YPL072W UBP16 Deubiquitinating enzyme anchored to the outer mitochondrial membrane [Kazachstania barnettii]CAD1784370.1 similar to Saccharomyces cerevisiae YPL072W UBP16 Deubiquitinating enzyme anchored to the outer mitochondrial membrane [Kazachstania barnettii]